MTDVSSIGIFTAFFAGIISFLSPCVLPLVPGYLSYITGQSLHRGHEQVQTRTRLSVFILSLIFVSGFSTVFIALGASATAFGRLLLAYRFEANIIGGTIIAFFGLFMTGLLNFSWFQRDLRWHRSLEGGRPLMAYILGLAFAFGWTPCIGPILGAILTTAAVSSSLSHGIILLSIYSLGLGIPFLAAAIFTDSFLNKLAVMRRLGHPLQVGTGVILIIMGIAMMTGYLTKFSYWLLATFPILGSIG